jgi:hypothetical protein
MISHTMHNPANIAAADGLRKLLAEDRRIIAAETERQRIAALRAKRIERYGTEPDGIDRAHNEGKE